MREIDALLSSLQVQVLRASTSNLGVWWGSRDGRMPEGRIYLIDRGAAVVKHHGATYQMAPGNLYLIPAHTDLVYYCEDFAVCYWCHFRAELHGRIDLFSCVECDYVVPLPDQAETRAGLEAMADVFAGDATGREFTLAGQLLQLLGRFLNTATLVESKGDLTRLQPVLAYIAEHLSEPIRVADLARVASLETTYFSRVFSRAFGLPPTQYIIQRRVEAAQRLLWHSGNTMEQIAQQLGFCDAFHFSKTFKRSTGMSPTAYRRSQRLVP